MEIKAGKYYKTLTSGQFFRDMIFHITEIRNEDIYYKRIEDYYNNSHVLHKDFFTKENIVELKGYNTPLWGVINSHKGSNNG